MKPCFKCGEMKPLAEFYPHPAMSDGYLNKCKECAKADANKNRRAKLAAARAYDTKRSKLPSRIARRVSITKRRRTEFPEYATAHNKVAYALRIGKLAKEACAMCGNDEVHAHHDDYAKPLDVMWLCPEHHKARHAYLDWLG